MMGASVPSLQDLLIGYPLIIACMLLIAQVESRNRLRSDTRILQWVRAFAFVHGYTTGAPVLPIVCASFKQLLLGTAYPRLCLQGTKGIAYRL
jgi:hypothetical protein